MKQRKKRSKIWKINKDELTKIVTENDSFGKILKYFNLTTKGGNVKTLKQRLYEDNINTDHIKKGLSSNLGRKFNVPKIPIKNILVEQSTYNRHHLKQRLFDEKLLENKCAICGLENTWQNKKISLQLDHINGVSSDNRLENLRILCPNCHSQTDTFCGKSKS